MMTPDRERYEAIKKILDACGAELALVSVDNPDSVDHLKEWIETLNWALEALPDGYESTRRHIKSEISSTNEIINTRMKRLRYFANGGDPVK